jgi:hypothetical protein
MRALTSRDCSRGMSPHPPLPRTCAPSTLLARTSRPPYGRRGPRERSTHTRALPTPHTCGHRRPASPPRRPLQSPHRRPVPEPATPPPPLQARLLASAACPRPAAKAAGGGQPHRLPRGPKTRPPPPPHRRRRPAARSGGSTACGRAGPPARLKPAAHTARGRCRQPRYAVARRVVGGRAVTVRRRHPPPPRTTRPPSRRGVTVGVVNGRNGRQPRGS